MKLEQRAHTDFGHDRICRTARPRWDGPNKGAAPMILAALIFAAVLLLIVGEHAFSTLGRR